MSLSAPLRGRGRLMALAVAALLGTAIATLPAGPAYAATWSTVATPNATGGLNLLTGIEAIEAADAWAVGHADYSSNPMRRPLVLRWTGSSWAQASTPALGAVGGLRAVDGSATDNVWAVGFVGSTPLTEKWDGAAWSVVPAASPTGAIGPILEDVKTFGATSAWAVGSYSASSAPLARTIIERWNGTSWSLVPSPNPDSSVNLLTDVDGAAENDVWAIGNMGSDGYGSTTAGIVAHFDGSAWVQVSVPGATADATLRQPVLTGLHVLSSNDVWIVGRAFHFGLFRMVPIFMHWNGQSWQNGFVANAPAGGFTSVTALSPTKVYAFGDVTAGWNGAAWTLQSTSFPGLVVDAAATGTATIWGGGYRYDPALAQYRTLAVRTTNG